MDDIVGKAFGKVTIVEFLRRAKHPTHNCYKHYYLGSCECGSVKEYIRTNLISGHTKSCGCSKRRYGSANPTFHGVGELGRFEWNQIVRHAESREINVAITIEDAWALFEQQGGKCALSGTALNFIIGSKKSSRTASLDRIDNSLGYIPGNVQWLHKDINWMKGRFTTSRFLELCRLVAEQTKSPK